MLASWRGVLVVLKISHKLKGVGSAISLSLALVASPATSQAAEWWHAASSKTAVLFVDRASIQQANGPPTGVRQAWENMFNVSNKSSSKALMYFNCSERSMATKSFITYDENNNVKDNATVEQYQLSWYPVAPDTIAESELTFVCNIEQLTGGGKSFDVDGKHYFFVPDPDRAVAELMAQRPMTKLLKPNPKAPPGRSGDHSNGKPV